MCRTLTAGFVVLIVSAPVVTAGVTVVDPDAYPAGTDISNLFPGVTLSAAGADYADGRVFALLPDRPSWASTGQLVFGHVGDYPAHWVTDTVSPFRYGALRADLSPPTTSVSIDIIGNDPADYGVLQAFDAQGGLLASVETPELAAGDVQTLSVSGVGDISYIIAGGRLAQTVCLDHIVIPEPGAALLGALLLLGARRRATGTRPAPGTSRTR